MEGDGATASSMTSEMSYSTAVIRTIEVKSLRDTFRRRSLVSENAKMQSMRWFIWALFNHSRLPFMGSPTNCLKLHPQLSVLICAFLLKISLSYFGVVPLRDSLQEACVNALSSIHCLQ